MTVKIKGSPEEIAALVVAIQKRREARLNSRVELDGEQFSEAVQRYMRDIFAESQPSSDN